MFTKKDRKKLEKSLTKPLIMRLLAMKLAKCIYRQFTKQQLDVAGNSFKEYSKSYGKKKRAKKFDRQKNKFANTRAPVLTGAFMEDLQDSGAKPKYDTWGFEIGWYTEGHKGIWLNNMGRLISTKRYPVPKICETAMYETYSLELEKSWKGMSKKKTIVKVNL
tara:strand:- start:1132 stop:1620 length:489 start_codon:yes stop_codon:yes gene_type:complete